MHVLEAFIVFIWLEIDNSVFEVTFYHKPHERVITVYNLLLKMDLNKDSNLI